MTSVPAAKSETTAPSSIMTADSTNPSSKSFQQIPKAIVKNADMADDMQQVAVDVAKEALQKFTVEKDIAAHVKKTMDSRYGATWHAVVGKNYGSYVTHETNHFIYFYLGPIAFLLWKA